MFKENLLKQILKKRAFLVLFPLLSSCNCFLGSCWQEENVCGTPSTFSSARIFLPAANEYSGLELEFVHLSDGLRMYINVFGLEIPPEETDSASSRVYISFRDHSYTFSAARLLGGQRLLIPRQVQEEILCYLQENQPVFIQVDRYKADIYPDKFLEVFRRMIYL